MKIREIYQPWHKATRPPDIIDFIIQQGGLQDQGGELRAMDLNKVRKGQWGILSTRHGLPLDHARETAEEHGYLPPGSTIADLLDAIRATSLGHPVYRPEDAYVWHELRRNQWHQDLEDARRQEEEDFWNPNNALAGL